MLKNYSKLRQRYYNRKIYPIEENNILYRTSKPKNKYLTFPKYEKPKYKKEDALNYVADDVNIDSCINTDFFMNTNSDIKKVLNKVLCKLSPKQERVIRLTFYEDKTLKQIADELSYGSPERVRQILARSLRMLSHPANLKTLKSVA
jgi:RNA polymerase sigma factor (sigma-70 family)